VDIEQAAEGTSLDVNLMENSTAIHHEVRQAMVTPESENAEDSLRENVVQELIAYLEERQQKDCADYFSLRLQDLPTQEIEAILGLTPRQRDYLQQRFKYHLMRFALSHRWELVHEWLEADLDRNLGLTPAQWQEFQEKLEPDRLELLRLKQQGLPDTEIAQKLDCTVNQVNKRWFKLLSLAWEIRNGSSGKSRSIDE
jgi:DNA-binding protein Fis